MSYSLDESVWLADHGVDDILLAYPTASASRRPRSSPSAAARRHHAHGRLRRVARPARPPRRTRSPGHRGVPRRRRLTQARPGPPRRSPIAGALRRGRGRAGSQTIADRPGFELRGVMFYDAQIAGAPPASASAAPCRGRSSRRCRRKSRPSCSAAPLVPHVAVVAALGVAAGAREAAARDGVGRVVEEAPPDHGCFPEPRRASSAASPRAADRRPAIEPGLVCFGGALPASSALRAAPRRRRRSSGRRRTPSPRRRRARCPAARRPRPRCRGRRASPPSGYVPSAERGIDRQRVELDSRRCPRRPRAASASEARYTIARGCANGDRAAAAGRAQIVHARVRRVLGVGLEAITRRTKRDAHLRQRRVVGRGAGRRRSRRRTRSSTGTSPSAPSAWRGDEEPTPSGESDRAERQRAESASPGGARSGAGGRGLGRAARLFARDGVEARERGADEVRHVGAVAPRGDRDAARLARDVERPADLRVASIRRP